MSLTLSLSSQLLSISRELSTRLQQPLQTRTSNHAQTTINTGSIEPLYTTCSHTQHTATSLCLSLSLFHSYELHYSIYLLYSPYTYSYLSIIVICFPGPPSYQRHLSKPTCEVRDPTQPHPSWRVTVPDFGKHIECDLFFILPPYK